MRRIPLFFLLVWFTVGIHADPKADNFGVSALQRALQLKNRVDAANQDDIIVLADDLLDGLDRLTEAGIDTFWINLEAKIIADKKSLQTIQPSAKKGGSIELVTTLNKLVGDGTNSGILNDALELMKGSGKKKEFFRKLKTLELKNNQITGYKTLLVYGNLVLTQEKNLTDLIQKRNYDKTLTYFYPMTVPPAVDTNLVENVGLYCRPIEGKPGRLWGPNDFYVFGGTPPELDSGMCRGSDCTGLLTYCMQSEVRLSTMLLEFIWRYQRHGENDFVAEEKPALENLIQEYKLKELSNRYEALDADPDKLLPGDLIVWRAPGHKVVRGGHAALFVKAVDGDKERFQGVEATREDKKSLDGKTKEGLLISTDLTVHREGRDTYVLRHK